MAVVLVGIVCFRGKQLQGNWCWVKKETWTSTNSKNTAKQRLGKIVCFAIPKALCSTTCSCYWFFSSNSASNLPGRIEISFLQIGCRTGLNPRNFVARENASEALLAMPDDIIIFIDNTDTHLSEFINKRNLRYWSSRDPRPLNQRSLQSKRVIRVNVQYREWE